MKNLTNLLLCVILVCLCACSNNDDLVEINNSPTPLKYLAKTSSFNYNGKVYSSEFEYTNDSSIIYKNNEVQEIAEKLDKNPVLVTFYKNNTIIYYDNESKFDKDLKSKRSTTQVSPRGLSAQGIFYKDANFKGAQLTLNIGEYPDLGQYGFNDCISSAKLSADLGILGKSPLFRLYENKNFGGRVTTLTIFSSFSPMSRDIPNLSSDINDKASSIKIEMMIQ
ncbi:hypothetical protein [Phocaeicola sp.]